MLHCQHDRTREFTLLSCVSDHDGQPLRRRHSSPKLKRSCGRFRLLSTHAAIYNAFNLQRHLITRKTMRLFRGEAMNTWRTVTAFA